MTLQHFTVDDLKNQIDGWKLQASRLWMSKADHDILIKWNMRTYNICG